VSLVRPVPTGARNGLDREPHDWTYRGKLTLEAELPYECAAGCGRRMDRTNMNGGICATCRGVHFHPPGKCEVCGYKPGSKNHRVLCGSEDGPVRKR
jgi:hypothetical protein